MDSNIEKFIKRNFNVQAFSLINNILTAIGRKNETVSKAKIISIPNN